ncbi:MAG: LysR family transcriptional regulator [Ginsengibacter sp.]
MLSTSHKIFLEVATHLSFSKAAKILFISQPAISNHIKLLEAEYKSALFNRKGNSISLTRAGKILFNHLQDALTIQRQIQFELTTIKDEGNVEGNLKLGASTTVALYIIPKILSAFHQKHPNLGIQLVNRNSENIIKALLENEIDMGIIEVENKITSISYQHFMTDEVIAVCSANSNLFARKTINVDDLVRYPVALREVGSGTLSALTQALKKHNIGIDELNVKVRLGGTEALKSFLLADRCMGFLPQKSVVKELAHGELVEIRVEGLEIKRDFYFIHRQGTEDFGLTKRFMRFAKASI